MSEKLCTLRTQGGGGGVLQKETVLWTNPSPTTDLNAQTVTISDNINNYDYIKVIYNYSSTSSGAQTGYSVIMPVSVFKLGVYPAENYTPSLMLGVYGSLFNSRSVYYVTDTSVRFGSAANVGSSGSSNNRCIPTAIIGIKNMGGKSDKPQFTLLSNYVSSTLNLTTITLDKDITKYNYIIATSAVMPDGYNCFVASKPAVEAIIDIQTFISRGSVTYGAALSNGTAYSITINYIDGTHISTSRTSATNRNLTFYAI